jgi:hypothetical protein
MPNKQESTTGDVERNTIKKKIHWIHNFEKDGFYELGSYTMWKGKCKCGATAESTDIRFARGESPTLKVWLGIPAILVIVINIIAGMYIYGIYPFSY